MKYQQNTYLSAGRNVVPLSAGRHLPAILAVWWQTLATVASQVLAHLRRASSGRALAKWAAVGMAYLLSELPAAAAGAAGQGGIAALRTQLAQGQGLIMLIVIPVGIVMIIRGIIMDKSNGEWKWELIKGLGLVASPLIMNTAFSFFMGGDAGIGVQFQ